MNSRKLLIVLGGYFALAGLAAHLLAIAFVLKNPNAVQKLKSKVAKPLYSLVQEYKGDQGGNRPEFNVEEEINQLLPPWVSLPADNNIPPGIITVGNQRYSSPKEASMKLKDGDILHIGKGVYNEPMIINANDVSVVGDGHVVFENTSAEGKAAIITKGNNIQISNIECRNIAVEHGNGACIRHQGKHLQLDHVYFHHSQQGVLTGKQPGIVAVKNSRFEKLGHKGQSHGIYMGGGELDISNSVFIASKNQGHAIKSRGWNTRIHGSLISSLSSDDSRLIDISNGGVLIVDDSILHQGPKSVNQDMIGYGLEGMKYNKNEIILHGNIIMMERIGPDVLLHSKDPSLTPKIESNIVISSEPVELEASNIIFQSREEAGLKPYPALPSLTPN